MNISVKVCLHICVYMYIWYIYDYKTCYIKDLLTSEVFIFPHNFVKNMNQLNTISNLRIQGRILYYK